MNKKRSTLQNISLYIKNNNALLIFVLLFLVAWFAFPVKFRAPANLINLFTQNGIYGLVALGMTFVILTEGIDLSVGSVVGISGITAAYLCSGSVVIAVGTAIIVGILCGLLNGFLVAKLKIVPFIATLSTMIGLRGLILVITGSKTVSAKESTDAFLKIAKLDLDWLKDILLKDGMDKATQKTVKLAVSSLEKFPLFVYFIVAIIIASYVLKYTKFGRSIYAVGGNENASKMMGLNAERTKVSVYVISGFLAGVAGVVLTSRLRTAQYAAGDGWEMDAIASTVIGGTLMTGGKGKPWGTFFGVLIIGIIKQMFNLYGGLNVWWQNIATGVILLIVVILQSRTEAVKQK